MPGLTVKQAAIYFVARELCENGEGTVRRCEIAKSVKVKVDDRNLSSLIDVLLARHFLTRIVYGRYRAVTRIVYGRYRAEEPPHRAVTREICTEFKIAHAELFGPGKAMRLCRARRLFARRLHKAGYLACDIGRILRRDASTISDYFNPERRLQRLIARTKRRHRAKAGYQILQGSYEQRTA